jgi:hypothetical protein
MTKPRRHQTDIRLASCCPAAWDIKGDRRTLAAARGTAVHKFVELYNAHRAKVGRQTDIEEGRKLVAQILSDFAHMPPDFQEEIHQLCMSVIDTHLLNLESFYGSEESFLAELDAVILSGRLDELHISGDFAEIVDTKSNHVIPAPSTVAEDFQLRTYGFLVVDHFPQIVTVKGTIYTPRFGTFRSAEWEREELVRWGEHLNRLINTLEMTEEKEAVPNSNCQYCAASLTNGGCPAWEFTYGLDVVIRDAPEAVEAAKQILALEQRLKVRREVLQSYCKESGKVEAGGRRFGYYESESRVVRPLDLMDALVAIDGIVAWNYLSVSATDLKKLRKALDKDADMILSDISDVKQSTRFSHKAVGPEE